MPFELKKVNRGWKVVDDKGREYSRKPLSKKRATLQQRALYAAYNRGEFKEIKGGYIVKHDGEEHQLLYGEGFFSDVFDKVKSIARAAINVVRRIPPIRRDYPPNVRNILAQYGNGTIVGLAVRREPIKSFINTALNWLTKGKWDMAKKEANYDNMFHLGLVADVSIGGEIKRILLEKNEVINITTSFSQSPDIQMLIIPVPAGSTLTLNQMLDNARNAMGDNFFLYDAFKNNCQNFIYNLLSNSGLMSSEAEKFILQPINELVKNLPAYTPYVARALTDIAAIGNRVIYGEGMDSCCSSCAIGKACMGANGGKSISNRGVRLNARAVVRGGAEDEIIVDEKRLAELQKIIPSKERWEASFKRRGATPTQTYEQYRANVEDINRKRATRNLSQEKRAEKEMSDLAERNRLYAEEVKRNPDLQQVRCNITADGEISKDKFKSTMTQGECRSAHQLYEKKEKAKRCEREPITCGLTKVADFLAENVAPAIGVPSIITDAYKAFGPSAYYRGEGLKEMAGGSIVSQLKMLKIPKAKYLKAIRDAGQKAGYDPKAISLATDGEHKVAVKTPEGQVRYAGRVGYGDYHIYTFLESKGDVPVGTASKKQSTFQKSHSKIKGDWKADKYSPNNLALSLLW